MPAVNMDVPHTLTQEEARERLNRFIHIVQRDMKDQVSDLTSAWKDDTLTFSFKTYGMTIKGDLTALAQVCKVVLTIPIVALPFRGKIEQSMRQQLERVLS